MTILFGLFFAAYLRRAPARGLASRPTEMLLPLFVASIVFWQGGPPSYVLHGLRELYAPFADWIPLWFRPLPKLLPTGGGLTLMAIGEVITVLGMIWLGRNFSLFVEARELVTAGPYQWVRHPLYTGELISLWGYVLEWPNPWAIGIAALVTTLQVKRAGLEERKLGAHFPEYAAYARRVGRFWPRWRTRSGGDAESEAR